MQKAMILCVINQTFGDWRYEVFFEVFDDFTNFYFYYLQEEALRQKRLASSRSEASASMTSSNRSEAFSVQAMNPDATALCTYYVYAALVVLVIGIIIGKWIFWTRNSAFLKVFRQNILINHTMSICFEILFTVQLKKFQTKNIGQA